jgi:hypothetical protein
MIMGMNCHFKPTKRRESFTTKSGRGMKEFNIIINGGEPLEGCPTDWDKAKAWEDYANQGREDGDRPSWQWDSGFKLDFDGPLLRVSSRFYPPKTHYGPMWDGDVTVYFIDQKITSKSFKCENLEALKIEVEKYIKWLITIIGSKLKNMS